MADDMWCDQGHAQGFEIGTSEIAGLCAWKCGQCGRKALFSIYCYRCGRSAAHMWQDPTQDMAVVLIYCSICKREIGKREMFLGLVSHALPMFASLVIAIIVGGALYKLGVAPETSFWVSVVIVGVLYSLVIVRDLKRRRLR